MKTEVTTCDECSARVGHFATFATRIGARITLCPKCAGGLCRQLVGFFADRKRLGLTRKPAPRNQALPRKDDFGHYLCRTCEVRLDLHRARDWQWKPGEPPYCDACVVETARRAG